MSNTPKILTVVVRPLSSQNQETQDQRTLARIFVSRDALLDMKVKEQESCFLWRTGEESVKVEALAYLSPQKNLNKSIVQISPKFQSMFHFKVGDELNLAAGTGAPPVAASVIVKDITNDKGILQASEMLPDLKGVLLGDWESLLKDVLFRAQVILPGMIFENVSYKGKRRSFEVRLVGGNSSGLAYFDDTSVVKVSNEDEALAKTKKSQLKVVDIAGIDQALEKLNTFLSQFETHFKNPWPQKSCGILLSGGHGTGKSFLIEKIVETGWGREVFHIDADAKVSTIKEVFQNAKINKPSIIVIDELDALVTKDDPHSRNIARVLGLEMDVLANGPANFMTQVLVVASTIDSGSIPVSLRERTRFRKEIMLPIPDVVARKAILKSMDPPIEPDLKDTILNRLGEETHAYTARDLKALIDEAYYICEDRFRDIPYGEQSFYINEKDIEQARILVRPTAMLDVTLKPPVVRWEEIGGQDDIKKALQQAVETPLKYPEQVKRLGLKDKKGILLYGPPGCSKTLSAQAMASEMGLNFFAVKGAELNSMYVGESERKVREIFAKGRAASPSIIFFDEIESIGSKRESGGRSSGIHVLTTLLNEMDGIEALTGVMILAATNKPEDLDLALLRPGRFDQLLYVAPPNEKGREEILKTQRRKMDFADDVELENLAKLTDGYSGAELVGLCQSAAYLSLAKFLETGIQEKIHQADFVEAMKGVTKRITPESIQAFEDWARGERVDTD